MLCKMFLILWKPKSRASPAFCKRNEESQVIFAQTAVGSSQHGSLSFGGPVSFLRLRIKGGMEAGGK